ncbi:MAG: MFS transporter [Cyanobacteria bacterium J06649_4]
MRTFFVIWLGQFASLLGSEMTSFAVTIWAWEITQQATPLSLILVVTQVPRLLISPFAGVWVDTFSRKHLMLIADSVAGLSTVSLFTLFISSNLHIWHLYAFGALNGLFGYIHQLAYSASLSLIVAEKHYTRASALESLQLSGSYVLAPAAAGALYAIAGLSGVLCFDLVTFVVAIATLSLISIPSPSKASPAPETTSTTFIRKITFGLRYLYSRPSLMIFLCFLLISSFIDSASFAILPAMVLARSNNDSTVWGTLLAFFGAGGILGGGLLSIWGGPKKSIHGVLLGNAFWKIGLIVLALAQRTTLKIGAALGSGMCSPFPMSCSQTIWRKQVDPALQGRVFSAQYLLTQIATPVGAAIAGPLADHVFEPAMQPNAWLAQWLGGVFGTGLGAGMAVQLALFSFCGMAIALAGYSIRQLRDF